MKKLIKEIIILLIQLFIFYIFPLFAGPTDIIGMVVLMLLTTFVLSIFVGLLANNYLKCFYPVLAGLTFAPSVFIYYNVSAFIHIAWYMIFSTFGILVGLGCLKLYKIIIRYYDSI